MGWMEISGHTSAMSMYKSGTNKDINTDTKTDTNTKPILKWAPMIVKRASYQFLFFSAKIAVVLIKNSSHFTSRTMTFDKSHLTKEEKEISPCWAISPRISRWNWLFGWESLTFSESIDLTIRIHHYRPCFGMQKPAFRKGAWKNIEIIISCTRTPGLGEIFIILSVPKLCWLFVDQRNLKTIA